MLLVHKLDRKKRFHEKSIKGCVVCKLRRVRCDRRHPTCYKCILSERDCRYDVPRAKVFPHGETASSPLTPEMIQLNFTDPREERALAFYMNRTRKEIAGFTSFTDRFWNTLIPQLCVTEPAIRHVAISVATRHEAITMGKSEELEQFCLQQHMHALHLLSTLDRLKHQDLLMLSCIALIAFDRLADTSGMDGRYLIHVMSGLKILRERRTVASSVPVSLSCSTLIDIFIEPMFRQMELMFCMFCPPTKVLASEHTWLSTAKPQIPSTFPNLKTARDLFVEICVWRYNPSLWGIRWTADSIAFQEIWNLVLHWHNSFESFVATLESAGPLAHEKAEAIKQQVCLLVGAFKYSAEDSMYAGACCYPTLVDLRTPSKLQINVRVPSDDRINLHSINGNRMCEVADSDHRVLPHVKRVPSVRDNDSILLEFTRNVKSRAS